MNKNSFGKAINVLPQTLHNIVSGRENAPSFEVVEKILSTYADVNPGWLVLGKGEPFLNGHHVSDAYHEAREPQADYPVTVTVDKQGEENIVLVEAKAAAGYIQHLFEPHYFKSLPTLYLPGKEFRNATHRAFQITGDSMQNTLSHGDIVIARFIENFDIKEGYVHVVVTKETLYIKRILNRIDQRGKLVLLSDNKYYTPVEIEAQDVTELWYVSRYISSNLSNKGAEIYNMILDVNDRLHQLETRVDAIKPPLNLE